MVADACVLVSRHRPPWPHVFLFFASLTSSHGRRCCCSSFPKSPSWSQVFLSLFMFLEPSLLTTCAYIHTYINTSLHIHMYIPAAIFAQSFVAQSRRQSPVRRVRISHRRRSNRWRSATGVAAATGTPQPSACNVHRVALAIGHKRHISNLRATSNRW